MTIDIQILSTVHFCVIDKYGEVLHNGVCDAANFSKQAMPNLGQQVMVGHYNQATQWINPVTGEAQLRTPLVDIVQMTDQVDANGLHTITFVNLPPGAVIQVNKDATPHEPLDGSIQFTASVQGIYTFYITAPCYYPHRYFVEVG